MNEFSKVIEAITHLFEKEVSKEIRDIVDKNTIKESEYQSEKITELAKAFSKAQGEYKNISFNRTGYYKNRYADLHAILTSVIPILSANGLSIYQYTKLSDETGTTVLHSKLLHQTGQWIETRSRIVPSKNDLQTYGATLTYHKRYSAATLLGITASDDQYDDDAEQDAKDTDRKMAQGRVTYTPKKESFECISSDQLEEMEYELAECPDIAEEILEKMHLQSLADLPKSKFLISMKRIREIKRLRNEGK
jgi:hypothetical protein